MSTAVKSAEGNFVSEWYGYRVFPSVAAHGQAHRAQLAGTCPFLSGALQADTRCVKPISSQGVCTISSSSNGPRQDWLVCPYRALGSPVFEAAARDLFAPEGRGEPKSLRLFSTPSLAVETTQKAIADELAAGRPAIVFFQDKIGGEISFPRTNVSPEVTFDITFVELSGTPQSFSLRRFGIVELQTMDFHGSYRAVVKNLKDALRLHGRKYHREVEKNASWLGEKIEGPNIANVFKRTFYQIILKFEIGRHERSAGCVFALPTAVWDSWQRHLGRPELVRVGGLDWRMDGATRKKDDKSYLKIYTFDLRPESAENPESLIISKRLHTTPEELTRIVLIDTPQKALQQEEAFPMMLRRIRQRLLVWWPNMPIAPIL